MWPKHHWPCLLRYTTADRADRINTLFYLRAMKVKKRGSTDDMTCPKVMVSQDQQSRWLLSN